MRRPARLTALIALLLWVVAGPLAGMLGACAAMSAMCEGPCGVGPCAIFLILSLTLIPFVLGVAAPFLWSAPGVPIRPVDPPPRPALSF